MDVTCTAYASRKLQKPATTIFIAIAAVYVTVLARAGGDKLSRLKEEGSTRRHLTVDLAIGLIVVGLIVCAR